MRKKKQNSYIRPQGKSNVHGVSIFGLNV